ncbi:High mobility group B protein 9 [Hibiscus syriacus]|uniref:High mobility group B protein 9 n=1 Tax=Hibiscus syriacus TaxID=106335 RepID=A0A6A2XN70_HIBSY|nr:high mobility group B protein 9-like [Hibiscus syriacus]KAE8659829.1 High mobility group B protein 9 [Hibiscus syriacus]
MDEATSKIMPSSAGKAKGRNGVVEKKEYPDPLTSHEEVVKDPIVFWDTLRRFHFIMGTKFMIPVIGGKELDLHVLYVEATKRGGYEKVVADKKWREVGSVFRFSPTTTSASFVLRKHYFSLLFHYEQVHFFKMKGPLTTPAVASPVNEPSCRPELALVEYSPKPIKEFPDPLVEGTSCFSVTGTIEGKFDCGYLISVRLGSEVLSGVLYHPEQQPVSEYSNAIVPYKHIRGGRHSRRRRRSRRAEDPSYPKPNRSGYNFFFAEKHYKLKSLYPNREREFTKMIGESWSSLGPEERMVYQNIGLKDKERYRRELKEYKDRLKQRQGVETEKPNY